MAKNNTYKKPTSGEDADEQVRCCLMCGSDFSSDGTHNRVCKRCKSTQAWREGGADVEFAA